MPRHSQTPKVFNSISPGHRFERQRDTVTPGSARPGTASQENLGIRFPGWGMLAKTRYALPWALLLDTFGVCKTTGLRTYRSSALPSVCLLIAPDFKNAFASRLDFK